MERRHGQRLWNTIPETSVPVASGMGWATYLTVFEPNYRHGSYPLSALSPSALRLLALATKAGRWNTDTPEALLLLDVETTGLNIEDGTLVFLIGIARFDEHRNLWLWQHLLTNPMQEPEYLARACALMLGAKTLVTFNGRAFDTAVLTYRLASHGLQSPLDALPHMDLLTAARRLWRCILPSCSLATLETALLGIYRWNDLSGWQIPSVYGQWLRSGNDELMRPIFQHNAADILSMVTLAVHISNLLEEPTAYARFADEVLKVAHCWERLGDLERAVRLYEKAAEEERRYRRAGEALARLARIYASQRASHKAAEAWQRLAEDHWPHPEPYLKLARALERDDPDTALQHAHQAMYVATNLGLQRYVRQAHSLIRRLSRTKA